MRAGLSERYGFFRAKASPAVALALARAEEKAESMGLELSFEYEECYESERMGTTLAVLRSPEGAALGYKLGPTEDRRTTAAMLAMSALAA